MSVTFPLQQPTDAASDFALLRFFIRILLGKLQTSALVSVQAVNTEALTVDVLPLVGQINGVGQVQQHGTIFGVPYDRKQGGASAFIVDPQPQDIGLVSFASRDSSIAKRTLAPSPPGSKRTYDWADAVYVASILNGAPTQFVRLSSAGIDIETPLTITMSADGAVTISGSQISIVSTAGETTIDGVPFGPHFHNGVASGSGDTGPVSGP